MTKSFIIIIALSLVTGVIADRAFDNYNPVAIDFADFTGGGFAPSPAVGQLDSDNWIVTGLSDGSMTWGETKAWPDFAQGGARVWHNNNGWRIFVYQLAGRRLSRGAARGIGLHSGNVCSAAPEQHDASDRRLQHLVQYLLLQ